MRALAFRGLALVAFGSCLLLVGPERSRGLPRPVPEPRRYLISRLVSLDCGRLVEGRLIGFPRADFVGVQHTEPACLHGEAGKALWHWSKARMAREHSAESVSDDAVLSLAANRVDKAVAALSHARSMAGRSALVASDLAAVLLARAPADPSSYSKALDVASQAVALDPTLPEAIYNLALALELNFLDDPGAVAWSRYLALDGSSGWAEEARRHLRRLHARASSRLLRRPSEAPLSAALRGDRREVTRLVRTDPQTSTSLVAEKLLPAWAAELQIGNLQLASRSLEAASEVAEAIQREHGDAQCLVDLPREVGRGRIHALLRASRAD